MESSCTDYTFGLINGGFPNGLSSINGITCALAICEVAAVNGCCVVCCARALDSATCEHGLHGCAHLDCTALLINGGWSSTNGISCALAICDVAAVEDALGAVCARALVSTTRDDHIGVTYMGDDHIGSACIRMAAATCCTPALALTTIVALTTTLASTLCATTTSASPTWVTTTSVHDLGVQLAAPTALAPLASFALPPLCRASSDGQPSVPSAPSPSPSIYGITYHWHSHFIITFIVGCLVLNELRRETYNAGFRAGARTQHQHDLNMQRATTTHAQPMPRAEPSPHVEPSALAEPTHVVPTRAEPMRAEPTHAKPTCAKPTRPVEPTPRAWQCATVAPCAPLLSITSDDLDSGRVQINGVVASRDRCRIVRTDLVTLDGRPVDTAVLPWAEANQSGIMPRRVRERYNRARGSRGGRRQRKARDRARKPTVCEPEMHRQTAPQPLATPIDEGGLGPSIDNGAIGSIDQQLVSLMDESPLGTRIDYWPEDFNSPGPSGVIPIELREQMERLMQATDASQVDWAYVNLTRADNMTPAQREWAYVVSQLEPADELPPSSRLRQRAGSQPNALCPRASPIDEGGLGPSINEGAIGGIDEQPADEDVVSRAPPVNLRRSPRLQARC